MSEQIVVSHFRSTDLIQPLKEQPDTVHFNGTFKLRQFKSNPDLAARKAVEYNRFDRIPSPPVCGPQMLLMHRKLEKLNPPVRRVENTCLYIRPRSMENKQCAIKQDVGSPSGNEEDEIRQICDGFGQQMTLLK
nr:uncharacterized protein LOC115268258 [Aedes albopictus]